MCLATKKNKLQVWKQNAQESILAWEVWCKNQFRILCSREHPDLYTSPAVDSILLMKSWSLSWAVHMTRRDKEWLHNSGKETY
jgi:hypothetical protein